MKVLRAGVCVLGLFSWSGAAHAETKEACLRGDCEYRFDDEGVNSPGHSAYDDWFKVRGRAKHAMLIRPRISFVMELLKSTQGI
jgi:hypothetical protein